jgi:hypothetical protein
MIEMKVDPCTDIGAMCRRAVRIANEEGESVSFCFNDTALIATPGLDPDALITTYWHTRGMTTDKEKCDDCKGSGWYVGIVEKRYCPTCGGSGYL